MYYPSSENKGADQLRGYREADLRLCFRLCRLLVFQCSGSNVCVVIGIKSMGGLTALLMLITRPTGTRRHESVLFLSPAASNYVYLLRL